MKHPKPHLVESTTAISEGNSLTALCGVLEELNG
jgi:hypothetical protein